MAPLEFETGYSAWKKIDEMDVRTPTIPTALVRRGTSGRDLKTMRDGHREQREKFVVIFYCIDLASVFNGLTLATYEISRTLQI